MNAAHAAHRAAQIPDLYDDPDEPILITVDGTTPHGTATAGKPIQHRLGAQLT
ncbi:hypothetical protein Aple_031300 [Acrocarpospora pleiomorpha]|uniref:Uncharacterized protein n=1 Tax=Acrocarpospora pleiomorpha TaxID=90975 RepID=A0A5M3XG32_9ACTN|nr:hypothetical protein [Acrocarpospora pleiomorpha]GES20234.1 hypothetical protein Aple_031300 [Acrocarpospora pleiomorpha]